MKKVIIFGCGGVALKAKNRLEEEGCEIIAYTDNDQELWGTAFQGKKVISVEKLKSMSYDYVAVGVYKAAGIIIEQLLGMGVPEEKIIVPVKPAKIFENPFPVSEECLEYLPVGEYQSQSTKRYLGCNIQIQDNAFLERLENLKRALKQYRIPKYKVCVVSGAILQAYGMRASKRFDDIDIIMTSDLREVYGKGLVIVSECAEMHPQNEYDISDDEIILNAENHFIFRDMKFMGLNILYRKAASDNAREAALIRTWSNKYDCKGANRYGKDACNPNRQ